MRVRRGLAVLIGVTAIALSTIPLTVLAKSLVGLRGSLAVHSARARFLELHGRSRSLSVERGIPISLMVDPNAQMVTVREGCTPTGRVVESRDMNLSYRVEVDTGGTPLRVCMTPRGYADPGSNSFQERGTVTFWRGTIRASVVLLPLGQAVEL